MDAIVWLQDHAPGFRKLSQAERRAFAESQLLWSLFEAKAPNGQGSAIETVASSARWSGNGLLTVETFRQELGRVRDRHVADGEFSCHFRHFHRRANDAEELVRRALICEDGTLANIAATVLIIACRFRSDLFRGWKWSYELQGQLENFVHLNKARKRAGELQVEGNSGVLK